MFLFADYDFVIIINLMKMIYKTLVNAKILVTCKGFKSRGIIS